MGQMLSAHLISAPGQGSTRPPASLPLPGPIPPKGVPSFRLCTTLWPLGSWWLWWCGCSVVSYSLQPHGLVIRQAPLSMGFSRQGYWSGLGCHFLLLDGDIFPIQGSNLWLLPLLHWQADSLPLQPPGKPWVRGDAVKGPGLQGVSASFQTFKSQARNVIHSWSLVMAWMRGWRKEELPSR